MQKLKLDLEHLRVDSFDTTRVKSETGTVLGAECTCDASCNGTCNGFSCNPSNCGDFPSCQGGSCVSDCPCPHVN
jgi:hypothetical protein